MQKIKRKSLLYKSGVEYADFCLNHVEGCSHGCNFPCYAMLMAKRFGRIRNYNDWIRPKLISNSLELLEQEIPKYKNQIKFVQLCFMTDPFMYHQKEVEDMSLKIIERLNREDIRCTVLTKGKYPNRLADYNKYSHKNEYGITLVSLNKDFRKKFEPNTAPYMERINSLKNLHEAGFKTWVSIEPYPTPNIIQQNLLELLNEVSFVNKIIFGKLNYNSFISQFRENKLFYENCADLVAKFCKLRDIDYHIKFGTRITDNKNTVSLFNKTEDISIKRRMPVCIASAF